jgi:nucleoside-diphosphate-sugar epimerase
MSATHDGRDGGRSPMRVALTGATGTLGAHVVPRLLERGHTVRALVRSLDRASILARLGVDLVEGELFDGGSRDRLVAGSDVVMHLATALPRPGTAGSFAENDRVRRDGTEALLAACEQHHIGRFVLQSLAWVDADPAWRESTRSASDAEARVREWSGDWRIVRGGLFYGERTGLDEWWRRQARAGQLVAPAGAVSLVHVADAAAAFVTALEADPGHLVVDAVDDQPVEWHTLLAHVAALEAAPPPATGATPWLPSFRGINQGLRRLGWAPRYASHRSGLLAGFTGSGTPTPNRP